MVDTCPFCGAETRQGDNFCLNCGNRLPAATPSAQNQQDGGEATQAEPQDWNASSNAPTVQSSGDNWNAPVPAPVSSGLENDAAPASAPTAQATLDRLPEPARFTLRSDSGEILQEYPLDKPEIAIGRAPTSDILLSKDKLTSRRHASIHFENGQYVLRDDHSANGTFINGQQLEDGVSHVLHDGDQVGIGEHELIFHAYNPPSNSVEDLPTIAVPPNTDNPDVTYRTRENVEIPDGDYSTRQEDPMSTLASDEANGDYNTVNDGAQPLENASSTPSPAVEQMADVQPAQPAPAQEPAVVANNEQQAEPVAEVSAPVARTASSYNNAYSNNGYASSSYNDNASNNKDVVSFNRFGLISAPPLPDMSSLMAALSTLDGQVMALQEQFNATQEAIRSHDSEFLQTANGLRTGIRRVSDRMDTTIAEVARSREALAWAELSQLMEDVMNNPRDIEYVTRLARKARELNKIFQIHQNVLNTMAECNSLLRSMIGEENPS
jgi:pSer/pThr/pTyr-binding forkhead associated (FHA) protein